MNNPKPTPSVNPIGGEGGSPGFVEVEASETITETLFVKSNFTSPSPVTNPTGGEGGTPGV